MHSDDESVPIVPDIENYQSSYIIRIWEIASEFYKILPSCFLHDRDPGGYVCLGLFVLFSGLLKTLDRNDVHSSRILRKLRSVN